jgi:hypothetical protein
MAWAVQGSGAAVHREDDMTRRTRVRPISDRRQVALREYETIKKVWLADPAHQACRFAGCRRKTRDVHHTRGRVGALLIDTHYWVPLCREHHDWVQAHPNKAREVGLLCPPGKWNVPPRRD